MSTADVGAFLVRSRASYVAELVAAGVPADEADRTSLAQQAQAFPDGRPAAGHLVFDVVVDGDESAGHLWIGSRTRDDPDHWWVRDVEVAERGGADVGWAEPYYAWLRMRLEPRVDARSVSTCSPTTLRLAGYESLGYERAKPHGTEEASIRLRKAL